MQRNEILGCVHTDSLCFASLTLNYVEKLTKDDAATAILLSLVMQNLL